MGWRSCLENVLQTSAAQESMMLLDRMQTRHMLHAKIAHVTWACKKNSCLFVNGRTSFYMKLYHRGVGAGMACKYNYLTKVPQLSYTLCFATTSERQL